MTRLIVTKTHTILCFITDNVDFPSTKNNDVTNVTAHCEMSEGAN